ncbi:multidrug transporter, partial [Pseudoalteromonas sp. S326]
LLALASEGGVSQSCFILAGPIAAVYLYGLYIYKDTAMPTFNNAFWGFVIVASVMQIVATGLMVKLWKMNNYARGAGLAKSEAVVAAIFGVLFFGSALCLLGWLGVILGAIAVRLLTGISSLSDVVPNTWFLG